MLFFLDFPSMNITRTPIHYKEFFRQQIKRDLLLLKLLINNTEREPGKKYCFSMILFFLKVFQALSNEYINRQ